MWDIFCFDNVVNVRYIEIKLYTKFMGSRTRAMKIAQNVWQLAHSFHTPEYNIVQL